MAINGLAQGFETDGNWDTMDLFPVGMTFTGDMTHMQVFYGITGYGATHSVTFEDITVIGCLFQLNQVVPEVSAGVVVASASMLVAFGLYIGLRRRKTIPPFP